MSSINPFRYFVVTLWIELACHCLKRSRCYNWGGAALATYRLVMLVKVVDISV